MPSYFMFSEIVNLVTGTSVNTGGATQSKLLALTCNQEKRIECLEN